MAKCSVRMYKLHELGDCFLLTFQEGRQKSHILIDCGSFRNSKTSAEKLRTVAKDISKRVNKKLDAVIATHQHNDHLSGFIHAQDIFQEMQIDQVILSWMDDPDDEEGARIINRIRKLNLSLDKLISTVEQSDQKINSRQLDNIKAIHEFVGANGEDSVAGQANKYLRELDQPTKVVYLQPGQVKDLPGLPPGAIKMYVLGPPRFEKDLKDVTPNKDESYDKHLDAFSFTLDDMTTARDPKRKRDNEHYPFNNRLKQEEISVGLSKIYRSKAWRRIDDEWLDQAEQISLYLDNLTNNTSLVIAFELVKEKKVLLFVGDAQTGNWKSWDTIKFDSGIDLNYLLSKVVLYKVGHHGSHNATFKPIMDKIDHKDLVAMIPVNKNDPNLTKEVNPWKMPARKLYRVLKQKTKGRIIRMDEPINQTVKWPRIPDETDLYCEYLVE